MKLLLLTLIGIVTAFANESHVLKDFAVGSTQFTAGVYKQLSKSHSGSFMVCPLSVDVLLALFHAGAKGRTARQITDGLHLPDDRAKLDETFTKLWSVLNSTDDYDLTSANKVYLQNKFQISEQFKNIAVNVFNSEIENIDFSKKTESAFEMNQWVEEKTHDKIKNLVEPDDIEDNLVAVLINAMYFRGKWVTQFDEYLTSKQPFHLNSKDEVQVEMMTVKDEFKIYFSDELNAQFLEMPYEGDDISMTIVLPYEYDGLSALEARIEDVLAAPLDFVTDRTLVNIPKFKMETTIMFKPILEAMGIVDSFSDSADFTGFGANQEHLKISKVVQKTFIEVEEKGTTAAAVTYGGMTFKVADPEFIVDHPFLYYIKIKDIIVFVGRYTGP